MGSHWGEWWGCDLFAPCSDHGTECTEYSNINSINDHIILKIKSQRVHKAKRLVIDTLKKTGCIIQLRYPRDIANLDLCSDPQIGWHNDAILSQGPSGPDSGTFDKGSKVITEFFLQHDIHSSINF